MNDRKVSSKKYAVGSRQKEVGSRQFYKRNEDCKKFNGYCSKIKCRKSHSIIHACIHVALPLIIFFLFFTSVLPAQEIKNKSKMAAEAWVPDLENGKYKNPIIYADYSDPDVIRVGDDFYLVASSFDQVPGLPILHSKDLVNWTIIGHALLRQPPFDVYSKTQHGNGVWAPSIRYHKGEFYIYYPDVDYGIYMVKAKNPAGPWSVPFLVQEGKGLEDPCPLWDTDGKAYLIHAYAGSRAGSKSILVINKMNPEGTKLLDQGVIVYDGHGIDPTVEGPKLYKRDGYYYIFAPAGGVTEGWQIVLRSKYIYGPYKRKEVLAQGKTDINGPHQGAWVETKSGQSWFIHFQDRGPYGRVDLLEPMKWKDNWPLIGINQNSEGVGEPVLTYNKPDVSPSKAEPRQVGKTYPVQVPQTSDEFNSVELGPQWQWQANPGATWVFTSGYGYLRLYAQMLPKDYKNYWDVPNILTQKFPAEKFTATTKLTFKPLSIGDKVGFIVMGASYAYLSLTNKEDGIHLAYTTCLNADKGKAEDEHEIRKLDSGTIYFKVNVDSGAVCHFSYSNDGKNFVAAGEPFSAVAGRWIGAKVGMFCTKTVKTNDSGFADFDWFRITQ